MQDAEERLTLRADLGEIERASRWARDIAARLAVPSSTTFALDLCLEEALSNTIQYGFSTSAPAEPQIRLIIARDQDALRVLIEDNAAPFNPCAADEPELPTDLATAKIGGLGIHLIRGFTTRLAYERVDGFNRLTFWLSTDPR